MIRSRATTRTRSSCTRTDGIFQRVQPRIHCPIDLKDWLLQDVSQDAHAGEAQQKDAQRDGPTLSATSRSHAKAPRAHGALAVGERQASRATRARRAGCRQQVKASCAEDKLSQRLAECWLCSGIDRLAFPPKSTAS